MYFIICVACFKLCQICRRDKNEARLLLCDGCDHGYHTYCFRPPLTSIPSGDWFCFDCISKATAKRHCFVCGSTRTLIHPTPNPCMTTTTATMPTNPVVEPAHRLVQCQTCSRGVHPACLRPPVLRLPRRWNCQFCIATGASKSSALVAVTAPSKFNSTGDTHSCDAKKELKVG